MVLVAAEQGRVGMYVTAEHTYVPIVGGGFARIPAPVAA